MQFFSPFLYNIFTTDFFKCWKNFQILVNLHITMYQGALLAKQKHLDWNTCSFLKLVRAADLQMGPAYHDWTDELLVRQNSVSYGDTIHVYHIISFIFLSIDPYMITESKCIWKSSHFGKSRNKTITKLYNNNKIQYNI